MDVQIYREFVGQLFGAQDIPVRARVEGFLEGIHFQEGSTVKKDQLLSGLDVDLTKAFGIGDILKFSTNMA